MIAIGRDIQAKRLLAAVAIFMLAGWAAWSISSTRELESRLQNDQSDLVDLRAKLDEIERLADAPTVAGLDVDSSDRIINRISEALDQAGLSPGMLSNQAPSSPLRVGQTDFMIRSVDIKLKACSVPQIVSFCKALKDESSGTVVRDLRLFDPQRFGRRETWQSQLTLTQLVYSPTSQ